MTRIVKWSAVLVAVALIAGCGGGGGENNNNSTNSCVLTGLVRDVSTNVPVVGATVKIGNYSATSNSQGSFKIEMPGVPIVRTFSVDGRTATPSPGYYDFWARYNGKVENAKCITLPVVPLGETPLGTVYLMNADNPPPFPPSCSQ